MSILATTLDLKRFHLLLERIVQKCIYNDKSVTTEVLVHDIFGISPSEATPRIMYQIEEYETLLRTMAEEGWSYGALETYLTQSDLTASHVEVFVNFWKKECPKIRYKIIKESSWNDTLENMHWRVDMIVGASNCRETQEPGAIIEMELNNKKGMIKNEKQKKTICFELNRNKLQSVLDDIKTIQHTIDEMRNVYPKS